jgi:copper(I)-binding protein
MLMMILPLQQQAGVIEIKNAWMRPGAKDMNTALYFEVKNNSSQADTLYDAKSGLAERVEVHETYMQGDMMGMRPAKAVEIKANSTFKFQPGGHHVMFINLKQNLRKGSSAEVTLYFRHAGEIKIKPEVRK